MRFRLSYQARADIEEIRAFTIERWGREQWISYFAGLSAALEQIADEPSCGRSRHLIRERLRSLPYGRHLIFFEIAAQPGGRVAILRVVHERRNFAALSYSDDLES
jgi:toxin ParE1/3/4